METSKLKEFLTDLLPGAGISEGKQFVEISVPGNSIHETARKLQNNGKLNFDYLTTLTAIDYDSKFTMIYHIEANQTNNEIILKTDIENKKNPAVDTISDIYPTAEFHEREVYDLFGISFNNHPDLRRLFLDDNYGFPLRKDFKDEVNFIELKK